MVGSRSSVALDEKPTFSLKRYGFLLFFLICFPIFPLTLALVFGGLLALVENSSFLDGFLYVASNLLNMATPLTDFNPNNAAGVIIDVYVSMVALLTFGIMLNMVNIFQVPLAINNSIERWVTSNRMLVSVVALVFVIPFWIVVIGVVFGSLLAAVEGWNVRDGILYVFSNLCSLGTPLTEVLPTTIGGDVLDIVISSLALGCVAIFVDYVTVLNPARYVRKRFREFLLSRGIVQLKDTTSLHPLDYKNENASKQQKLEQKLVGGSTNASNKSEDTGSVTGTGIQPLPKPPSNRDFGSNC
mmetsp:Transcript_13932/g.26077  ORF Transcript_13932/g.26077 Transcript_13932/m.26077 type:complete len:300 (-) Transcript_13932:2484-3383(-)